MYLSGYAFRHASRYGAETWHGNGPTKGQMSSRGQSSLGMSHDYQIFVRRTSDINVVHYLGLRPRRGHLGSHRG